MGYKSVASPLALIAALALSTGAFAQTMLGDQAVTDEDLPSVSEHCQMLAENDNTDEPVAEGAEAETNPTSDQADATETPSDGMATDPAIASPGDPMAGDANLDLEAITLDDCQAAGLIE